MNAAATGGATGGAVTTTAHNDVQMTRKSESETADRDSPSGVALNLTDFM